MKCSWGEVRLSGESVKRSVRRSCSSSSSWWWSAVSESSRRVQYLVRLLINQHNDLIKTNYFFKGINSCRLSLSRITTFLCQRGQAAPNSAVLLLRYFQLSLGQSAAPLCCTHFCPVILIYSGSIDGQGVKLLLSCSFKVWRETMWPFRVWHMYIFYQEFIVPE